MTHDYVLVFDLETSGLNFYKDRIIELGAVLFKRNDNTYEIIKEIDDLVKINFSLSNEITNLTHITNDMLLNFGIYEEEIFNKLEEIFKLNPLLIAYNIQFDINFIIELFRRYSGVNYEMKLDVLDCMAVYKDYYPYPHRLESAVSTLNIEVLNTHRALDDVRATICVLDKLNSYIDIKKYINILGYNPKYGVSGERLKHVRYIAQYGNKKEILKAYSQ